MDHMDPTSCKWVKRGTFALFSRKSIKRYQKKKDHDDDVDDDDVDDDGMKKV